MTSITAAPSKPNRSAPTRKGQATRARILEAGRDVLVKRGYFSATVAEIAEESGLALGSIYRYFDNKDDLFLELLEVLVDELFTSVSGSWTKGEERESLRRSSRRYLATYYDNRRLIAGLLEMSAAVPECAERWWDLRQRTFRRKTDYVRSVTHGDTLKPELAATALATMVEQLAFHWFVESDRHGGYVPDLDEAADVVSLIWYRAIYAEGLSA